MPPKSKKDYPALLLSQKGDVEPMKIPGAPDGLTIEAIQAHFKKRQPVSFIGFYAYTTFTLFLFGTIEGEDGSENQHQLPEPYDSTVFYNDLLVVVSKDENSFAAPVLFSLEEYEAFYTKSFGGYMSEGSGTENEIVEAADVDPEAPVEDVKDFPEEEDDDDDDDDEEEEEEVDLDVDQPVIPKVRATKKKKVSAKVATASLLAGTSTAYADKPTLSEEEQLQEMAEPSMEHTSETVHRRQVHATLLKLFSGDLDEDQTLQLETSIYNAAIKRAREKQVVRCWSYPLFVHIYRMCARHIASNFDKSSYVGNTELYDKYESGEIQIKDLATMNQYELCASRWKAQFESQYMREKRQLEGNRSMATDIFLCKKCHKRECTYYEMQTRSADEPMTIFITCLNCGKHWRQ